jgi:hypothetical protein
MAFTPPRATELFAENPVQNMETLKGVLRNIITETDAAKAAGELSFVPKVGIVKSGKAQVVESMLKAGISADVVKEWELGSPIAQTPVQNTGYTPYNVEPAVLMIVPKELKLRNTTARVKGIGQGIEYRRVTGVSNSTSGNILSPFFTSTTNTVSINGTTLNRPPLISYTGDTTFKPYVEMGFTDSVSLQQQFAGQDFTDIRALSHLALIWAHTLGEERALLNARSTVLSVASASGTAAADSTVTGSGLPAAVTTAVYATFSSSLGESKAITLTGTPTTTAGEGIKITSLTGVPAGTLAINIYANYSGTYYKGTTVLTTGASPTTFATVSALPSTSADNGSGNTLGYDGAISEFGNSSLGGYQLSLNAVLALDTFTTALQSLYISQGADPDMILTTGSITQAAFDLIQTQGTATSYRANFVTGDNGVTVGGAVTGFVNPATGKVVDFSAHRYMPAGTAVVHSTSVPWGDSGVTATMKVSNVVDTMVIDWPQIGMSYDQSTYSYGTVVFEAPILSGVVTNINN